jgi:transcriptional regulator with XRE-family HTH domain
MANTVAQSIDLQLPDKLHDRDYRRNFFLAESSARIAEQLIALRKRRGLSQKQVAELTDTRQPAISRAEQADYQNWSFNTLRSIADALDARIRVSIEPSEDVISEYEQETVRVEPILTEDEIIAALSEYTQDQFYAASSMPSYAAINSLRYLNAGSLLTDFSSSYSAISGLNTDLLMRPVPYGAGSYIAAPSNLDTREIAEKTTAKLAAKFTAKDDEIAKLRAEVDRLKSSLIGITSAGDKVSFADELECAAFPYFSGQQLQGRAI